MTHTVDEDDLRKQYACMSQGFNPQLAPWDNALFLRLGKETETGPED